MIFAGNNIKKRNVLVQNIPGFVVCVVGGILLGFPIFIYT